MAQNKTLTFPGDSSRNQTVQWVYLPLCLLEYLGDGYALRKPGRFSKLKAFIDLIVRYCRNTPGCEELSSSQEKETGVNISQLAKEWGWSRLTVSQFVGELDKMDVIETHPSRQGIFVSIKPDIVLQAFTRPKAFDGLEDGCMPSEANHPRSYPPGDKAGLPADKKFSGK